MAKSLMQVRTEFPRAVREIESIFIALPDGTQLAARIWLPLDAESNPVPAILEYIPYRKNDGTAVRDALYQPYFAGHGYAAVRVDMRGSGDSDGIMLDEYLLQEQDDGLAVLAWLAAQPWCTGAVGIFGKSWGGFNGLQIAARRPPQLRAVISVASTDDRYADDVHYRGGCLMTADMPGWAATMLAYNARPPDPRLVGERWRSMWLDRLEHTPPYIEAWLTHQRRDAYWQHGSVCEDPAAIECPVYLVGGWADGYSNTVLRLLAALRAPSKALIGPWPHEYAMRAVPGPQIGFMQECLRWWDHWLKGKDTGIMAEPRVRVWMQESIEPCTHLENRLGRWVAEDEWPAQRTAVYSCTRSPLQRWLPARWLWPLCAFVACKAPGWMRVCSFPWATPATCPPTSAPPTAKACASTANQCANARKYWGIRSSAWSWPQTSRKRCWLRACVRWRRMARRCW
ncbi:hypothetical protein EMGBD1_13000 [Anaerolineaceae bacterium]|nr:hypothetical protein EMGBD1_13000 [Anaerolineaceae bacterium]